MQIPMNINVLDIQFLLPMVDGKIDGYYKVEKLSFATSKTEEEDGTTVFGPCIRLKLSNYHKLGDNWVHIYRNKMQHGELITLDMVTNLYKN